MRRVKVYRWSRPDLPNGNFGDEITFPLLERLFSVKAVPVETHQAELIGAGSILQMHHSTTAKAPPLSRSQRLRRWLQAVPTLHVWGTGLIGDKAPIEWPQKLIVHATRGALSAAALKADVPHGDPGILASLLLDRSPPKRVRVGLVPHFVDADEVSRRDLPHGWEVIDPRRPVHDVITSIASAEMIVSSSLHGLIVADAFAIPCVWAATVKPLAGPPGFKFRDHAMARRQDFGDRVTYDEATMASPAGLSDLATIPGRSLPDWQAELIAAFPFA